jgi:hypothetical protein
MFKTWQLAGTRYFVKHCGHPTANYPWYGERPDGSIITSGALGRSGMAFRYLDDAKVAVELDHAGQHGAIALTAWHGPARDVRIKATDHTLTQAPTEIAPCRTERWKVRAHRASPPSTPG